MKPLALVVPTQKKMSISKKQICSLTVDLETLMAEVVALREKVRKAEARSAYAAARSIRKSSIRLPRAS